MVQMVNFSKYNNFYIILFLKILDIGNECKTCNFFMPGCLLCLNDSFCY